MLLPGRQRSQNPQFLIAYAKQLQMLWLPAKDAELVVCICEGICSYFMPPCRQDVVLVKVHGNAVLHPVITCYLFGMPFCSLQWVNHSQGTVNASTCTELPHVDNAFHLCRAPVMQH